MKSAKLLACLTAAALLTGCAPQQPPAASSEAAPPAASSTPATPEPPKETPPSVVVDWSRLEAKEHPIQPDLDGGRWYPDYTDHLPAGEAYGLLLPYGGTLAQSVYRWTDDQGVEHTQPGWNITMYGLMTREGKLVTDPVYQYAEAVTFRKDSKNILLPVLALGQAREEWQQANNGLRYAMAAEDGRWVTDFEFWGYTARADELMLYGPAGLTWLDAATGHRVDWSWEFLGVDTGNLERLITQLQWLYGFLWLDEGIYLGHVDDTSSAIYIFRPDTAEVVESTTAEWEAAMDRYYAGNFGWDHWQLAQLEQTITLIRGEEQHTLTLPVETDSVSYDVKEGLAAITDYNSVGTSSVSWLFDLVTGEVLLEGKEIHFATPREDFNGLAAVIVRQEDGSATIYGPDLKQLVTVPPTLNGWVYVTAWDDFLTIRDDKTFYGCYDLDKGAYIFYRNLTLGE